MNSTQSSISIPALGPWTCCLLTRNTFTKVVFALLFSFYSDVAAFGQGTVWFRNKWAALDTPFHDEQGVLLEGPDYVAQLYFWKADGGFAPAAGNSVPFSTNGWFFGGTVLLPFVPERSPAWVQVRAWRVEGGKTFEEAALAGTWTGVSEVLFLAYTGSPSSSPPISPAILSGLEYPGVPLIVRQPQVQAVRSGEAATLSVIASSGVQTSYQWHQQPSTRPDGLIEGATNSTHTTPPLNTNTTFWVSIANSAGSVISDKATVTVVSEAPSLTLEKATGPPLITLDGTVGLTYRIEYITNLNTPDWSSLVDLSLQTNPFTFTDSGAADSPARFYRAVVP